MPRDFLPVMFDFQLCVIYVYLATGYLYSVLDDAMREIEYLVTFYVFRVCLFISFSDKDFAIVFGEILFQFLLLFNLFLAIVGLVCFVSMLELERCPLPISLEW